MSMHMGERIGYLFQWYGCGWTGKTAVACYDSTTVMAIQPTDDVSDTVEISNV